MMWYFNCANSRLSGGQCPRTPSGLKGWQKPLRLWACPIRYEVCQFPFVDEIVGAASDLLWYACYQQA